MCPTAVMRTQQQLTSLSEIGAYDSMSGIATVSMSQELTMCAGGALRYCVQRLPVELLVKVMAHLPDLATLSRLFNAYPTAREAFQKYRSTANNIFVGVVTNMTPEIRNACLDVLAARNCLPENPGQITKFIKGLDAGVYCAQLENSQHCLSSLLDLIAVSENIESLTESFASNRVLAPCKQHEMPLSPVELHRIQRSFWRFQLCYDMCHPERLSSSWEDCDANARSTRRFVRHQTSCPSSDSVPNWLQCREERHRPEALSRFLPNLEPWEHDELEAIRFHLTDEVNRLQRLRSCDSNAKLIQAPLLLQRLIRDVDHWDPESPRDHVLVASFRQRSPASDYPIVWDRHRENYKASSANTKSRYFIQVLQEGQPQWGWCLWDEERLIKRGMIDLEYFELTKSGKWDDESHWARIYERRALLGKAHAECVNSQIDWDFRQQYDKDVQMHKERLERDAVSAMRLEEEMRLKEHEWMSTELDCMYNE